MEIKKAKEEKKTAKEEEFDSAVRYFPNVKDGLTSSQVQERVEHGLTNEKKKTYSKTLPQIIFRNVFTFFNMLLLAIAIALISVGSYTNCFFLGIVILNTAIGIYQENKAKKMVASLRLLTEPTASLIRDGKGTIVGVDDIVLDDIVVLEAGKEIVVDGEVLDGFGEVNESLLTGESIALKKKSGDKVFAGSFVVSGTLYVKAEKIGDFTYVSRLQSIAKKQKRVKSVLLHSLNRIIHMISIIILPLGIGMIIVNYFHGDDLASIVSKTAGSLVSMIPSGLFLLTSTTLYVSVVTLGRKHALVQELYSIESLARSNVLCLDKTGTITDGTMHLDDTILLDESEKDLDNLISSFLLSFQESNMTSDALKRKYHLEKKYESVLTVPFSSERKYSAVTFKENKTYFLGAPEYLSEDEEFLNSFLKETDKGNRVLLFTRLDGSYAENMSKKGTPVCYFVLEDHIREDAFATIDWFQQNDVELKVISGDNPNTVRRIAEKVGIKDADRFISLEGMSVDEVKKIAANYTIFGRVNPEQKAAIIQSLKKAKKTVAMTGDGVNDILALKQANCSIAMAAGSEAARNCSHIVLMDSSFASMPKIVEEGRKVINNIQYSSSLFLMKTVYAILLSILVTFGAIFQLNISYPFEPKHLYILEFAVIGIPSFFLALQPNKKIVEGDFFKNILIKALPGGLSLLTSVLLSFFLLTNIPYFGLNNVPNETIVAVACISLSALGLLILGKMCFPFNWYRTFLYIFMLGAAAFILFVLPFSLNGIRWQNLTGENVLGIFVNLGICFLLYLLLNLLTNKFGNTIGKVVDNLGLAGKEDEEEEENDSEN